MLKYKDRLYDSIFGYINLTDVECEVINTPIFQRLHHIKQLGLANIVFPTAVHTRFAHSLGVMYAMDKIITYIRKQMSDIITITPEEHQLLRLAALLHDIGHLPLSHVGESATEKFAQDNINSEIIKKSDSGSQVQSNSNVTGRINYKLHEELSQSIVVNWKEIKDVLDEKSYDPIEIGRIITGTSDRVLYTQLLHSELDADRLDYLLRDAGTIGVAYGGIELDHIVSTLSMTSIDNVHTLGIIEKGLHAVEHYVLARYFMYSQIVFYPKVYYLEKILERVYEYLIKSGILYDEDGIKKIIETNDKHKLYDYNDHFVLYHMRKTHDDLDEKSKTQSLSTDEMMINNEIKMLLSGDVPSPILCKKIFVKQDNIKQNNDLFESYLVEGIKRACSELSIPVESVTYGFPVVKPTKIRGAYNTGNMPFLEEGVESIRIIYEDNSSKFLVTDEQTVLKDLSLKALRCFYLFINPITLRKEGISQDNAVQVFRKYIGMERFS